MDTHTDIFPIASIGRTHAPSLPCLGRLKISFKLLAPAVFDRIEFLKFFSNLCAQSLNCTGSNHIPPPIVDETATLLKYRPFADAGRARINASITV